MLPPHWDPLVSVRDFIYPKILFRWFEEKRKLFQAKQALVVKTHVPIRFFSSCKSAKFWPLIKRFWVNNFENFLKYLLLTKSQTNQLKL